jgi:hypothetical protein
MADNDWLAEQFEEKRGHWLCSDERQDQTRSSF